ncbi:lipase family alpha/beta hydrolase [Corynebacterium spheniscorum]|uniref:Alpha/beta hydrolase family protein n=1 Tax=Corynebacterium spheniscorum TaxID=185761 RepID=A0A1I2SG26_9CORY|nr:alpha/beta hydrolase [Corynebacterium spheniscorum]SFG51640.1 Alpha/beta hydrolase family protein [Corynebacterium spheniscorum]
MSWITRIPTHLPLPDPVPWDKAHRIVVVLHGTASSPGIFRRLAREMRADHVRVEGVPYAAAGTGDLHRGIEEVAEKVNEIIAKAQGRRVDVVGHSLGGLMALRLLHRRPHIRQRITTLIGLGACWRGVPTMRARWAEWMVRLIGGKAFTQIKQPLPFSPQLPEGVKVVSVVSDADTVVPADSATLGTVVPISGVSHRKLPGETGLIRRLLDLPSKKHAHQD